MSAQTATNGRPRKQLSDQLDRLDGIIDVLAEGLPGAVTDACREGARAAVKDAIIEIISNPELRALIASMRPEPIPVPPPSPEPKKHGLLSRLKSKLAAIRDGITGAIRGVTNAVASRCRAVRDTVVLMGTAADEALPARRILLVGLCIGAVVGVATLFAPQTVAAAVSGVTTTATAVIVQTGSWLKRVARRVGLLG